MALTITQVADYLAATAPPLGVPIKKGKMPDLPDAVLTVYEYPGLRPSAGFGEPGLSEETPGIQITVRGAANDYEGPRAVIERAHRRMLEIQAKALGGADFRMVTAQGSPAPLKVDANQRNIFTCSYLANKRPS